MSDDRDVCRLAVENEAYVQLFIASGCRLNMNTPGCSLILASNAGDSFSDAHSGDILVVATDTAIAPMGSLLLGFATTGLPSVHSSLRVDPLSVLMSGSVLTRGFSNVAGATYSTTLSNAGSASFLGGLTAYGAVSVNGNVDVSGQIFTPNLITQTLLGIGFSNVRGLTYAAVLNASNVYTSSLSNSGGVAVGGPVVLSSNVYGVGYSNVAGTSYTTTHSNSGNAFVGGPLLIGPGGVFTQGLSNIGGVTYTSNMVGLSASVLDLVAWSNVGVGVGAPAYPLDVLGDVRSTGTVYASGFTMVGTSAASSPSPALSLGDLTHPILRNRIINGDMRIDQRCLGSTQVLTHNQNWVFVADRMIVAMTSVTGSLNVQKQAVSGVGGPGPSLASSLLINVAATDINPGASDFVSISQHIEGDNLSDFGWGTLTAMPVTVSFWVNSSVTGTFAVSLQNNTLSAATRSVVSSFTIGVANTWTRIVSCFAGDQAGEWATGSVLGAVVRVCFMCGNLIGLPPAANGQWRTGGYVGVVGQTNLLGTLGARVNVTGMQLERGTAATPFELRPFWFEMMMCRRYCHVIRGVWQVPHVVGYGGYQGTSCITLPVPQRTNPTLTVTPGTGTFGVFQYGSSYGSGSLYPFTTTALVSSPSICTQDVTLNTAWTVASGPPVLSAGMSVLALLSNGALITFSAEL